MDRIVMPTPDGPVELPVITLPSSAFTDLRGWDLLGDFEPVELAAPDLS